jgi:signal transduction histidine kinase
VNIKSIPSFVKRQITHPGDNKASLIFRYGWALFLSILALGIGISFQQPEGKTTFFLIFLLANLLSVYVGGSNPGLIVSLFGVISSFLFVYPSNQSEPLYLILTEVGLFILLSLSLGYIVDLIKQVDLIREFNRKEKNLLNKIDELESKYSQAQQEIKIREEFISIASHELKTPLTSTLLKLQGALHNIKNTSLADFSVQKLLEMLESAEGQTQRLAKMINDLLNVSIIRTGRLDLELEELDLNQLVKEVVVNFKERAEKEGYKITSVLDGEIKIRADKIRITQVISNLLSNAMKYGQNKPIEIKVSKELNTAKIIVKDQGIGIPRPEQEKIFALFERVVNNSEYKGLGIGLYISNQIVKAHKGKVKVESSEGKGATFIVELPIK